LYQFWVFIAAGLYPHERKWFHWFVPLSGLLFFAGAAFMYCLVLILSLNFLVGFASWIPRPDAQPNALEKLLLGGSRATTATQPSARNGSDQSTQPAVRMLPVDPTDVPIGTLWFNTADGKLKLSTDSGIVAASLTHEANRALVAPHLRLGEYLNFVLVMTLAFGLAFQTPLVVYALARTGIVTATAFRRYRRVVWFIIVVIAGIVAPPDLLSHLLLSIPMIVLFELGLRLADRATPPRSSGEDVPSDERGGLSTTRP
jgi:Sec-independent protein secretion pathway component TatC